MRKRNLAAHAEWQKRKRTGRSIQIWTEHGWTRLRWSNEMKAWIPA